MSRIAIAAVVALSLAACGSEKSGTITGDDGESVEYSIDDSEGETTATLRSKDGEATVNIGKDVKVALPDGFSIYPGAKIEMNTSFAAEGGAGGLINMTSTDSPAEMAEFYRKQAEKAGVKVEMDAKMGDRVMLSGSREGGVSFTFNAGPAGDKTEAQLMVGDGL